MWSLADIADAIATGLHRRAEALDAEQAVRGLDALDELALHPILAESLAGCGFGVHREQRYPADRPKKKRSEGERCDLVLTPDARALASPGAEPTLFDPPDAVPLDDAFWLEVKVVAQHTTEGPNSIYGSNLLSTVRHDITKLSKDWGILHCALLLVLFTEGAETASHDLRIWQQKCLERGLPIGAPRVREIPINDRLGNSICAVAVCPVPHV